MSHRSKLDPRHIVQHEHNEELKAKKVQIIGTELAIELNADDGDSVQIEPRQLSQEVALGTEADVSNMKNLKIYVKSLSSASHSPVYLQISPLSSGDFWVDSSLILTPSSNAGDCVASQVLSDVMAKRARIVSNGSPDVVLVLVGRGN